MRRDSTGPPVDYPGTKTFEGTGGSFLRGKLHHMEGSGNVSKKGDSTDLLSQFNSLNS